MKRHRLAWGRLSVQGFSLIELMISLSIGLVVAGAAFTAYLGAARASKLATTQGRMYGDAQAALTILTQQLRMAGSNPQQMNRVDNVVPLLSSISNPVYLPAPTYAGFVLSPTTFSLSSFSIRACKGQFSNITTASKLDDLLCPVNTGTQSIGISYEADRFNTEPTEAGLPTDCLGNALQVVTAILPMIVGGAIANVPVTYAVADNRFYIGSSASVPSLYCKGNGADLPLPMVENIEDLQFSFGAVGTSSTANTAALAGYLNADEVNSRPDMALLADDAARWGKVVTVRICVLVRSVDPVVSNLASARYLKCDGTMETSPADLRLRRAYHTTVVLRNRRL